MRAGELDQRVTVRKPVRTRDAIGASVVTWEDVATVWASIWPAAGREATEEGRTTGRVTHEVRMRKRAVSDMKPDHRIEVGTRVLEVVSVLNVEERGEMWRVLATEAVR